jgi:hypothetical protein
VKIKAATIGRGLTNAEFRMRNAERRLRVPFFLSEAAMLDAFPFSELAWARVNEAAAAVTNATLQDDEVLAASKVVELQMVLASLREAYGDHPVLLETEADFLDDPMERRDLYLRAIRGAVRGEIPTYTIRISLAALLLESFADRASARAHLADCATEVTEFGDAGERAQWNELMTKCSGFLQ